MKFAVSQIVAVRPALISLATLKANFVGASIIYPAWIIATCYRGTIKRYFGFNSSHADWSLQSQGSIFFNFGDCIPQIPGTGERSFANPTIGLSFALPPLSLKTLGIDESGGSHA